MDGERNGLMATKVPFPTKRRIDILDSFHPPTNVKEQDELYVNLWHACAGPSVYVPRAGEKVFYFPQGHMEQIEAHVKRDETVKMPIYKVPPKILCRVLNVHLQAEPGTDEVFAQIDLIPEQEQDEQSVVHRNYQALPRKAYSSFFSKKLSPSDTSTHGGFSIPKRHANDGCLPPLDLSQETPQQDLVALDLHGSEWAFRHIYRGKPKRHLLTSGWSSFVNTKRVAAGDTFIFLRGKNGELRVGIRRAKAILTNLLTSIISCQSLQHGILASAYHSFYTTSKFTVYYRPWTCPTEFIVPLDRYMKSAQIEYCKGSRVKMQVEDEEFGEKRIFGTIIGIEDVDHIRWPNSEWNCLKVKWDPLEGLISRPERVCPWNVDPVEPTNKRECFFVHSPKKARPNDPSCSGFTSLLMDGMWHDPIKEPGSSSGVLQGQENKDTDMNQSTAFRQQSPQFLTINPDWISMQKQMENQIQIPICNSTFQSNNIDKALFSGGQVANMGFQNNWSPTFFSSGVHDDAATASRKFPVSNVNSQERKNLESRNENENLPVQPNNGHGLMLFGKNIVNSPPELPSQQVLASSELENLSSIPPTSQSSVSEPSKGTSSNLCNNCCFFLNRSCTKVLKQGTALGRSVDLTRFNGYEDLICELDRMFDFNGRLTDGTSGWHVTYIDVEGDMMLIGDHYPWQKFQCEVRKMVICPKE